MTEAFGIVAGLVAGVISAVAFVPYAVAIVRGRARPSLASWIIWTAVGAVLCASYWASGARASVWVAASYFVGPLVISLLALKYGEHGWSRFDKGCLAAALLSLGLWLVSGSALVALYVNILIDLLGALPTIRKAWDDPGSEDRLAWGLFLAGNAVNLAAVETWSFAGAVYPVYLLVITLVVNALLFRPPSPGLNPRS